MTIWPASVAVTVEFRPEASSATRTGSRRCPGPAAATAARTPGRSRRRPGGRCHESNRRDDQDRGVDEKGQHQRDGRCPPWPLHRIALALVGAFVGPGLHDRGVQIEIVRHEGGADDADGDVEHGRIGAICDDARTWRAGSCPAADAANEDLDGEATEDDDQQRDDGRLRDIETPCSSNSSTRKASSVSARRRDRGMPNSSCSAIAVPITSAKVAGDDRQFAGDPEHEIDRAWVIGAAGLGEVAAGGDAQPRRQRLQQDRHQVGQHDDEQQS